MTEPITDIVSPSAAATVTSKRSGGIFSGGKKALEEENAELRAALESLGLTEREQIRKDIARLTIERDATMAQLAVEETEARQRLASLNQEVIATSDEAILQEVGIYEYRHPLDGAALYKDALKQLREQYKTLARGKGAVIGATAWQVDGSAAKGRKMVDDFSKLMLRAYNAEADDAVRAMKPYKLESAAQRLEKARTAISRLGKTMSIQVTEPYHQLRVKELELTADYLARTEEEKERAREERERLRDDEKARRELERERVRLERELEKEQSHYESVIAALQEQGDDAAIAEAEAKLDEIRSAIAGVDERAANTRAGYVYVISNLGAFGKRMVKIGMTRRLDPMDRVRELGDASVPFRYDVHALIFSSDAVGLETQLHHTFGDHRVNRVNLRREFFYATPEEVRDVLADIDEALLLEFDEEPEAVEWHQSENERVRMRPTVATPPPAAQAPTDQGSQFPPPQVQAPAPPASIA